MFIFSSALTTAAKTRHNKKITGLIAAGLGLPLLMFVTSIKAADTLPSTLQYKDVFNLEYAASPVFSSDGNFLYYERRAMDIMKDASTSSLWRINLASGQQLPIIADGSAVTQATFSPDGKMVAYIGSDGKSSQLFVRYLESGESAKLTNLTEAPSNLAWSHDGNSLAFTLLTPSDAKPLFNDMPAKPEGADWAESAKFIENTDYRADGAGYLPAGQDHIYLLPVSGGTPRQLTTGNFPDHGPLSFSADDQSIYFSSERREDYALRPMEEDIYKVAIDNGEVTAVTQTPGPEVLPKLSPDGKTLAFLHVKDRKLAYQNAVLTVMTLSSGDTKPLTSNLDRAITDFKWHGKSNELIISYEDHAKVKLAKVNLSGKFTPLEVNLGGQSLGRPYTSGEFAVSSKGAIAYTTDNSNRPADIALLNGSKQKTLTDLNSDALGHLKLAEVRDLKVSSSLDKLAIDAWVAYPPDFDANKKYPLILEIHGGPHAAYGPHFTMEIQLMAAKGYVVVWSNPRGSSSYGEDFGNLIHHNYPSNDYQDLMDVVDAVIAKGSIDEQNLFITGGSGGGVLTAWTIGKTNRFKAAVVAKPVINWMSFALTSDAYPYFSQYWMPKMPWEIPDHLWQHSPLSLVGNVKAPTLLLTGESDYRTPISESEQFYQALRLQGVDAAMVRIPGASHGITGRPSRLIQKVGNILAWFDRYRLPQDASNEE